MSRHVTFVRDALDAGELASLIGTPIFDNADQADLCLTADEWSALVARRRHVGWPLHFAARCYAETVSHA